MELVVFTLILIFSFLLSGRLQFAGIEKSDYANYAKKREKVEEDIIS